MLALPAPRRVRGHPDRLDFSRVGPTHLGLGLGLHACIGAAMARTVVSAAISELVRAWPDLMIEPGCAWQRNLSIRGLLRLPVRLERAATAAPRLGAAASIGDRGSEPLADLAENLPRAAATLRLTDVGAVRDAVVAANDSNVALYPLSGGMNWGIGSRAPIVDGSMILDLGGMQRIRELDLECGIAVVEPGVSQGALADRLAGTPFMLNVTTSCRDSSVLGNALDCGQGALRLRIEELLGVEAVLGNGTPVATGVLAPAAGGGLFGRGSGPDATQLFCQSNFGVVTAAAIALVRRPERTSYLYVSYVGEALAAVVDCLAKLRRERVIDSIFYFGEMQLEPGKPVSDFTLLGPLLGRTRLVGEALEIAREELARVPGCKAVRAGDAEALVPGDPLYHRGRNFLGIPSCEPLRKRFGTTTCELDATSRSGWSVVQTLVPIDGRAVSDALAVLKAGVDAWGVTAHPHISSVTPTALNLMTMIWFQRTPEHIARMRGLRDELQAGFVERGYPHSREGVDLLRAAMARGPRDPAWAQIKATFDPNGIIAPGRYVVAPARVRAVEAAV